MSISFMLTAAIWVVGLHSVILGTVVYFFTVPFTRLIFPVVPDDLFFLRQSGVFLFLMGLFYLSPLLDMRKHRHAIVLIIVSKATAVAFLLSNAALTSSPPMIRLAALSDGTMAATLSLLLFACYKKRVGPFGSTIPAGRGNA